MRISDWSSDVCSSDLQRLLRRMPGGPAGAGPAKQSDPSMRRLLSFRFLLLLGWLALMPAVPAATAAENHAAPAAENQAATAAENQNRQRAVSGKREYVRVDTGGRRIITKKQSNNMIRYTSSTT